MTIAAEDNHTNQALIPLLGIRVVAQVVAQVLTTKIQDENNGTKNR